MATIWVSANGNDSNDGSTYALAKATLVGGLGAVTTGDTLNIVNDGTHLMMTFAEQNSGGSGQGNIDGDLRCRGTSWDAPGLVIQGVDSSGNAAIATIASQESSSRTYAFYFRDRAAFVTIKGIRFNWTDSVANSSALYAISTYGYGVVPLRVYDCELIGNAIAGAAPAGARSMYYNTGPAYTTETAGFEMAYCYVQNCADSFRQYLTLYHPHSYHHNVVVWHTDNAVNRDVFGITAPSAASYKTWSVSHNTFYLLEKQTTETLNPPVVVTTTNATNISVHSNLMFVEVGPSASATAPFATHIFNSGVAASGNGTRGTMGYNAICSGTNVSAVGSWSGNGYYDDIFNPSFPSYSATSVYNSDLLTLNVTRSDVFNGTSSWTWTDPRGDGYSHTLPFDMRPIIARTLDYNGDPAGAVKAAIIVPIDPDAGGGGDAGSDPVQARRYIDSYPFYQPLLLATTEAMVRVRKNREYDHLDVRHYLQDHVIDEHTSTVLNITSNTTKTVTLGGVDKATGVLITTDTAVPMTITYYNGTTNATFTVTVTESLVFDQCEVRQVYINNTSSATANVAVTVFE